MDINKEDLKFEIINVDTNLLLNLFSIDNMLHDPSYYDTAINLNDDQLMRMLNIIEASIRDNYEQQVYRTSVKKNLYRLLEIFRDRFKDNDIIDKTNELRLILNSSKETNALELLGEEFRVRYLDIMPKRERKKYRCCYTNVVEDLINRSISYDYYFFNSLIRQDKETFMNTHSGKYIALTNLSNLLHHYPMILKDKMIIDRLLELLNQNIEISKDLRRRGLKSDDSVEDIKEESVMCLKRIKKAKLDRS